MVPVTFSEFWGGYWSREGSGGRTMSAEHPQNFSQENQKRIKRRGGEPGSLPLPYEIRTGNLHQKSAPAKTPGSRFSPDQFFWSLVFLESLELFEEESLVDLAGVAGLAQVVLFEGACATGGVSAPASNRLQIVTT